MKAVEAQQQDVQLSPQNAHQVAATPPKLHSSYSSNDVPTTKSTTNPGLLNMSAANNSHAQQHFHNHNASLGRIPPNAASNRLSKDLTNENQGRDLQNNGNYPSITSALQANAPAFGPQMTHPLQQTQQSAGMIAPGVTQYNGQTYYNNGYNMSMVTHSLQNMQLASMYNPYASYNNAMYQPSAVIGGNRDSQQRVIQQRRQHDGQGMSLRTCPARTALTIQQPWRNMPMLPSKVLVARSMLCARTNMAAASCRRSWRTATLIKCT